MNGKDTKDFLKHFAVMFGIFAVLLVFVVIQFGKNKNLNNDEDYYYDSPNTERVYGDRRVFDYADQLTPSEEETLTEYIHAAEKKTLCDIVIVTLNRSLADYEPEYMANYSIPITPDRYVMVYADKFWEDNKFGYDSPQVLDGTTRTGDGVILVDNLFREPETGKIYTWLGTTGIAEDHFSEYAIDSVLDNFYERVDSDYFRACVDFVDSIEFEMDYETLHYVRPFSLFPPLIPAGIGVIAFLIYFFANRKERAGKVTTTAVTYVVGGKPVFNNSTDTFLYKNTTRVYNPPSDSSSGGGGGGHHSSGGGGSHGGGGHSR